MIRQESLPDRTLTIGPSLGWASAKLGSIGETMQTLLTETGATATEAVWGEPERVNMLLEGFLADVPLRYRSLHLGALLKIGAKLTNAEKDLFDQIKRVKNAQDLNGTSSHPDITTPDAFRHLTDFGIPVGIENMDREKEVGKDPEEIAKFLESFGGKGVLDLQHAYEIAEDLDVDLLTFVDEMISRMEYFGGVRHLHVSGELKEEGSPRNIHALLTYASNRDDILDALGLVLKRCGKDTPIILEGEPLPGVDCLERGTALEGERLWETTEKYAGAVKEEIDLVERWFESAAP